PDKGAPFSFFGRHPLRPMARRTRQIPRPISIDKSYGFQRNKVFPTYHSNWFNPPSGIQAMPRLDAAVSPETTPRHLSPSANHLDYGTHQSSRPPPHRRQKPLPPSPWRRWSAARGTSARRRRAGRSPLHPHHALPPQQPRLV